MTSCHLTGYGYGCQVGFSMGTMFSIMEAASSLDLWGKKNSSETPGRVDRCALTHPATFAIFQQFKVYFV
jgi:hypothetical protein